MGGWVGGVLVKSTVHLKFFMVYEKRDCNLPSINLNITFSSVHCDNDVTAVSATLLKLHKARENHKLKAV